MNDAERDKLYDWLENGRMDVYLRRLVRERLAELEEVIRDAMGQDADTAMDRLGIALWEEMRDLLDYQRPKPRHGGAAEALSILRDWPNSASR